MKKKLKVFRVWVDDYGYDQYDSAIIVAESREEVLKQIGTNPKGVRIWIGAINDQTISVIRLKFDADQGEIHVDEIDLTKPGQILTSFNAG